MSTGVANWYDVKLDEYLATAKKEFERCLSDHVNGSVTFNFSDGACTKIHTQEFRKVEGQVHIY